MRKLYIILMFRWILVWTLLYCWKQRSKEGCHLAETLDLVVWKPWEIIGFAWKLLWHFQLSLLISQEMNAIKLIYHN